MFDLNQVEAIHAADPDHMAAHIQHLPQQLLDGWAAADAVPLPATLHDIDRVVIAGLGGSAIGGSLLAAWLRPVCALPVHVVRDYDLPAYATGARTLVIASSNSGHTEETLAAVAQARDRGCQIMALSTGGRLGELAYEHHWPFIQIAYDSQPRAALGWSLAPLLNVAARLNWQPDARRDLLEAVQVMQAWNVELGPASDVAHNLAKREAGQLMGRYVLVFGAGYFAEVARRWAGQINENAKAWASWHTLPEANHNVLAGTEWPESQAGHIMALFLTGTRDQARNAQRSALTKQAFMLAGCNTDLLTARGDGALAQMLSLVQLGDWMSFYLALLYEADPTPVEALVRFKHLMAG